MVVTVFIAFSLGWAAFAGAMLLSLRLAIRLKLRAKSDWPDALKRWHSIFSWPYYMIDPAVWDSPTDRRLAAMGRWFAIVAVVLLAPIVLAYLAFGGVK